MPDLGTASLVLHPLARYGFLVLDWSTDNSEAARLAREEEWVELRARWDAELLGYYIIERGERESPCPALPDLASIVEAAAHFHVSRHTLYKAVQRAELPTYKATATSMPKVKLGEVGEWIAARPRALETA